ncbi:hypothetical protein WG936_08155 [Corynebacterium sp. H127]|uniref:hypothetical protein n=1 Tax=Corynebacterium sp. H127 TaxID=3133418 RepID=UPI0030A75ACC
MSTDGLESNPLGFGADLRAPGKAVYEALVQPGMDMSDVSLCEEAGRMRDRLDRMQKLIAGEEEAWARLTVGSDKTITVRLDSVLQEARQATTVYRQLIGDIKRRWPDAYAADTDADGLEGLGGMAYVDGATGA